MENSTGYINAGQTFPAVPIAENDARESLNPFSIKLNIRKIKANHGIIRNGHTGILTAWGCIK